MELVFLLIFFFFILINVIIGVVSSRAKKKRLIESRERKSRGEEISVQPLKYEERTPDALRKQVDSFVEPQTIASLMESIYPEILEPQVVKPEEIESEVAEEKTRVKAFTPSEMEATISPSKKVEPEIKPLHEAGPELEVQTTEASRTHVPEPGGAMDSSFPVKGSKTYEIDSIFFDWGYDQKATRVIRVKSQAWKRIESLPPLKRAIVLSELLGEPKGLW
ncbi:MAG: hypothetical protein ACUVWJ_03930 [Spirochaetota bacterium]